MKAEVQYNDWVGTAAADIADEFANSIDEKNMGKNNGYPFYTQAEP